MACEPHTHLSEALQGKHMHGLVGNNDICPEVILDKTVRKKKGGGGKRR